MNTKEIVEGWFEEFCAADKLPPFWQTHPAEAVRGKLDVLVGRLEAAAPGKSQPVPKSVVSGKSA